MAAREIDDALAGYRELDERSNGLYRRFLEEGSRCTRCSRDARIPVEQQPIPLLCGRLPERRVIEQAHNALAQYRREGGSLRINPDDGTASLIAFLDRHGLAGLSIGHCGWGDLTARLRGAQLAEGVDVMILGADWYPLTACSNFLLDRYREGDHTLACFQRNLREALPTAPEHIGEMFRRYKMYLGNTLLCYRTGWAKQGTRNLSRRSFEHCREHLGRHLDAVAARIIITFGREPARSMATLVQGRDASSDEALTAMQREPAIKRIMERHYASDRGPGISVQRAGRDLTFVPLCHPSMPNRYKGDYAALAAVISDAYRTHSANPDSAVTEHHE